MSDDPRPDDATSQDPRFEDLMDFPAEVRLRALGTAVEGLAARCAAAVIGVRADGLVTLDEVQSKRGRFSSVRVSVLAQSADELRSYYAALHAVDEVHMVF